MRFKIKTRWDIYKPEQRQLQCYYEWMADRWKMVLCVLENKTFCLISIQYEFEVLQRCLTVHPECLPLESYFDRMHANYAQEIRPLENHHQFKQHIYSTFCFPRSSSSSPATIVNESSCIALWDNKKCSTKRILHIVWNDKCSKWPQCKDILPKYK